MQTVTPIKHYFLLLLFMMLCGVQAGAQSGNVLFGEVEAAKQQGTKFTEYNLFSYAGPATMLDGGSLLAPKALQIATLYNEKPSAITIQIPSANGRYTLSMLRSNPMTTDMRAEASDENGTRHVSIDKGLHYTGCIEGQANTLATMSIFANGDVMILFANKDGNYVAGALQDNSNRYILYRDDAITGLPPYQCKFKDSKTPQQQTGQKTTGASFSCKVIGIYLEGDYDLYLKFGKNITLTQNYLVGLFNQMMGIYKNDSMLLKLRSTKIWTSPDNYKDSTSEHAITDFMAYWNSKNDTFAGDLAILVANDKPANGGIAPLLTLCNKSTSYGYADVDGVYKSVPVYSKDVMVISHEVGHLLGSMHTQWCGWDTGPGGACGAIDDCAMQEPGSSCGTCPSTFSNAAPTSLWSGTIMSYCHTKPRGINLANGFGPLPRKVMLSTINDNYYNKCLQPALLASLKVENICRGYGSIIVEFDTNYVNNRTIPVSSLLFYWTTGATTQNLTNITAPGSYGVSITNSLGLCHVQYVTSIMVDNTDSCRFKASINNIPADADIRVLPNPCRGICTISNVGHIGSYTLTLYDMMGKMQLQKNNQTTDDASIDTSMLPSGVYSLSLRTNENIRYVRFIVP